MPNSAMGASSLWIPQHLRPAQKRISVVFYHHVKLDRVLVGFPESFPAPKGFLKIVCTTAAEVDRWSAKLRAQERREEAMTDEQREAVEGPIRACARQELQRLMANARNQINKDFCRAALAKMDEDEKRRKMKTTSFMHAEGFEDGK